MLLAKYVRRWESLLGDGIGGEDTDPADSC